VLDWCAETGHTLTHVINTHTHWDHIGVNQDLERRGLLKDLTVIGPSLVAGDVPGITHGVDQGDEVQLGALTGCVMRTEGHIDGHVSYVFEDVLFCGDTLFGAGCGYLFDGPPAKMHASLQCLSELDGGTRVCCAHEYTEDNLRFAWMVEPDNAALAERIRQTWALRARGECSVPSTIDEERATNPFLRGHSETLRTRVAAALPDADLASDVGIFAATRALKDRKDHRALSDEGLPLP
jgi:hydroxyacylglutathione hydrolase